MYLLDTPACSEPRIPAPSRGLIQFLEGCAPARLYTSVIVIGELLKGSARHPDAIQRSRLRDWVYGDVIPSFGDRILSVSHEVAERWGILCGEAMRRGETLPAMDSLIAATALVHGLTVVTRNEADFRRCGVDVRNPWAE